MSVPTRPLLLLALLGPAASSVFAQVEDVGETRRMPAVLISGRFYVQPVTTDGDTLSFYTDTGGGLFVVGAEVDALGLEVVEEPQGGGEFREVMVWPEFWAEAWIPAPGTDRVPVLRGEAMPPLGEITGMLGHPWFDGRTWTFDYAAGELLYHVDAGPDATAAGTRVPLGFRTSPDGERRASFPRIRAIIDGRPLDFLLDTGATTVLTEDAVEEVGGEAPTRAISFLSTEVFRELVLAHPDWRVVSDADRTIEGMDMIRVPKVVIAGETVGPVWFVQRPDENFHEFLARFMDRPVDGALGGNVFRFFRITVDYPRAVASFDRIGGDVSGPR